ncbi:MAG: hypothetical protein GX443_01015 [Deltaproteobacteria bacterium]|nr:hypothetical protein [Deltaproteobacteria bacterium]
MALFQISRQLLDGYAGKNIVDICAYGYSDAGLSHCAHFVSHVLQLQFGYTCGRGGRGGRNVRVHEIFANCPQVGRFNDRPSEYCLIFVTKLSNVNIRRRTMKNVQKKHVGIYCNGTIWHYSNLRHRVVTQRPAEFIHHYPNQTNGLFYGAFPADAAAIPWIPLAEEPRLADERALA